MHIDVADHDATIALDRRPVNTARQRAILLARIDRVLARRST